jgi:membrane protease YdiL (CAAX protease family)
MTDITDPTLTTTVPALRKPFWRGLRLFVIACLITIGVLFGALIVIGILNVKLLTGHGDAASMAIQIGSMISYLALIAFLLFRLPRLSGESLAQIGLRAPRLTDLGLLCAAIAIIFCADIALGLWLEHIHVKHTQAGFEHFSVAGAGAIIFTQINLSVVTPVAEELLFRGVLFRTLTWRMPVIVAALISSLLFSAIHGDAILFVNLALLGFLAAMLYRRTGNLVVSMLLHGLNNLAGLSALLAVHHT